MIDLYSFPTPNGRKIHVALEELELPYRAHRVHIGKGEQFTPEFLAINPNNKIPAIVDQDGPDGAPMALFESGAILMYLADKAGRLFPTEARARHETVQWLMFQMANVGPMFGQAHHFRQYAPEKIAYGIERYTNESKRLLGVMDRHLETREWLAAGSYTIADIATYPWVVGFDVRTEAVDEWPNVARWVEAIRARPAVERAWKVLTDDVPAKVEMDDEARKHLFGRRD